MIASYVNLIFHAFVFFFSLLFLTSRIKQNNYDIVSLLFLSSLNSIPCVHYLFSTHHGMQYQLLGSLPRLSSVKISINGLGYWLKESKPRIQDGDSMPF